MRIGIFTDAHYSSQEVTCKKRYNSRSLAKIEQAYDAFASARCELVISLGDLIDKEGDHEKEIRNLCEVARIIEKAQIPTVAVMGNHDAFCFTEDEFYEILGAPCKPRTVTTDGKQLLFADACYYKDGTHYAPGGTEWQNTCLPHVGALTEALALAEGDCYLFLHQNVDPSIRPDHRICNAEEVRTVIEQSGRVRAVFQGHYHPGCRSEHNGIRYVTFPAMCENESAFSILEL